MFNVGDLIIYSVHGVCRIDSISEKTIAGVSKHYYDLHPLSSDTLKISTPVDNRSVLMLNLVERDEAEEMMESFKLPGIDWIDNTNERNQSYSKIVNSGNRKEIARITNTLIRKKHLAELNNKKLGAQDLRLLTDIQSILFDEMAISLGTTHEAISDEVQRIISQNP